MPKLLAVPNIDKFAHLIREQGKIYQPREVEEVKVVSKAEDVNVKEYEAAAKRLASAKLNIRRLIIEGKGLGLHDPVSKEQILAEFQVARKLQVEIEPENLQLASPLSSLGEYKVPPRLPKTIPKPAGDEWLLNVKIRKR